MMALLANYSLFTPLLVTHQLLVYADDVNLLGDNIDAIKKNMETLIDASKEVGLEVNTEKTKYMLLSRHQNAGQSHNIKICEVSQAVLTASQLGALVGYIRRPFNEEF
jgi:hypothetical protein